jgi:hypothetical protein
MPQPHVTIRRDDAGHVTAYQATSYDPQTTQALLDHVLEEAIALADGTSRRPPTFGTVVRMRHCPPEDLRVIDLVVESPSPHIAGHIHVVFAEPVSPAFREAVRAMCEVYLNGIAASPDSFAAFWVACAALADPADETTASNAVPPADVPPVDTP